MEHYFLSYSGGKDSTASAILAHELGLHLTIVYSHFYFDKSRNIPATLPEHEQFIQNVAFPKFKEWGFDIIQVEPDIDYVSYFFRKIQRGVNSGCDYGFPIPIKSSCWANSCLKVKALNKCKSIIGDNPQIIGIAFDEKERYTHICTGNKISLLYMQGITENDAKHICSDYGLLSPIYEHFARDGCWFCNQMSIGSSMYINEHYPELVSELISLEQKQNSKPNCQYFARGHMTVTEFFNRKYKEKSCYNYLDKFF